MTNASFARQQELGWASRLIPKASRGLGGALPEGVTAAGRWAPGAGLGAELGDGVRSGSLAGPGILAIRGFPERAELEERWW